MTERDFSVIADARAQLGDAFKAIEAATDTLTSGGLEDLAQDLRSTVGGLRHFAGPDGVLAHVEKGEGE